MAEEGNMVVLLLQGKMKRTRVWLKDWSLVLKLKIVS